MLRTRTFKVFSLPLLMIVVTAIVSVSRAQIKSVPKSKFVLSSPDAQLAAKVPELYTANVFGCSGGNMSPPLQWTGAPAGTKSFVVTLFDPDEHGDPSGWWHWIVYNLPATVDKLPKGAGAERQRRSAAWNHAGPHRSRKRRLSRPLSGQRRPSTSLYLHRVRVERRETRRARRLQRRDGGFDSQGAFVGEGGLDCALWALKNPNWIDPGISRNLVARIHSGSED